MKLSRPRVSIGLPVYNGEQYLKEAIDSILSQTFADFELVISDNASTDATQSICQEYAAKDRRVCYYRNELNLGLSWNFNRVFELSVGEYFKWTGHDDVCKPKLLAQCVDILDTQPAVTLCYPKTIIINERGQFVREFPDGLHLVSPNAYERYQKYLYRFRDRGALCNPIYGLIRANVLKMTSPMGNYPSSDEVLLGELALRGKFYELSEPLFLRRKHPLSATVAYEVYQRAVCYNPGNPNQLQFQLIRWRELCGYIASVDCVPLSWSSKIRCYGETGKWAFRKKRILARELKRLVKTKLGLNSFSSTTTIGTQGERNIS